MIKEEFVNVGGTKVFQRKNVLPENKKAIVFMHGYSFTSMDWDRADLLNEYPKIGFNVYAPDYPGFGRSETSAKYGITRGSIQRTAEFIRDYMAANGISRAVLLGASMGGGMVINMAIEHPDLVEAVIAVAPAWIEGMKDRLGSIKAKVLLVWGSNDHVVPVSLSKEYADLIRNSKLEIVSGSGHPVYIEKPDQFRKITTEFLRSI